MTVGRICIRDVDLAEPDESVQVAARRMHSRKVGTLVVLDEAKRPIGIVSDRDLTVRVLAEGLSPIETTVGQVMTHSPRTVSEETPIEEALAIMRSGPFRRIPIVDADGTLVGLLSVDDVLELLREEFNEIAQLIAREGPAALAHQ
jgi:CBS domain-containing protein